jgi:hypothetical protein
VHQLGACPQGLRPAECGPVGQHEPKVDDDVVKLGRAADGGPLADHVPVLGHRDTVVVTADERRHQAVLAV